VLHCIKYSNILDDVKKKIDNMLQLVLIFNMVDEKTDDFLYTVNEVLDILRITRPTLYRHIRDKKLKAIKIGKLTRIRQSDLDTFTNKPLKLK
jgi:excisionase family DNA binding protein